MKFTLPSLLILLSSFFLIQSCSSERYEPAQDLREAMQERMSDVVRLREAYDNGEPMQRREFTRFAGLPNSEFVDDVSVYQAYFEIFDDMYEEIFKSDAPEKQFNIIIQSCYACHQDVCPGPLRAIKRLEITEL